MNRSFEQPCIIDTPDDLAASTVAPAVALNEEPQAPFPTALTTTMIALLLVSGFINGSPLLLLSALLGSPLLLWRLFVTLDEWREQETSTTTTNADQPSGTTSTTNQIERP